MTRAEKVKEAIRKGEGGGEGGHRQRAAGKRRRERSMGWRRDPKALREREEARHEAAVG